jgi:histidinol dehydrogenase
MLTYDLGNMTADQLDAVMTREGVDLTDAIEKVRPIVEGVRDRGDKALLKFARSFDGFKRGPLTVPKEEISSAKTRIPGELLRALTAARKRIEKFHSKQILKPFEFRDSCCTLGQKVVPLERVGVYVPGGTADYMSTVLMACVPARIAGVDEIAICTPGRAGRVPDAILASADMCGVTEIHAVGGAHSIAAMAYGTESIARVQKIVGPGGAFVTAAKLLVRNDCEIDFLAGPSEILVIADLHADPKMIASDMLAQLEHDPLARAVLVTDSKKVADWTSDELDMQLANAVRGEIASKAAEKGAICIVTKSISEAVRFANSYAPEHLLVDVEKPKRILKEVRNAGSVFLGRYSSVAFGDYCSGTNHILPTKGVASMRSSLSVYDFLKIIPYQSIGEAGAVRLSKIVNVLARSEGLPAHAEAASIRSRRMSK